MSRPWFSPDRRRRTGRITLSSRRLPVTALLKTASATGWSNAHLAIVAALGAHQYVPLFEIGMISVGLWPEFQLHLAERARGL